MINNRQSGRRRGRGGQQRPQSGQGRGSDQGNRIDNRARGNASQLHEKYKTLARDAQTQGDRVMAEYYLQFADHYFRILSESRARFEENRRQRDENQDFDDDGDDMRADDGSDGYEGERQEDDRRPQHQQQRRPERGPRPQMRDRREESFNGAAESAPSESSEEDGNAAPQSDDAPRARARIVRPRRAVSPRAEENGHDDGSDEPLGLSADRLPPALSPAITDADAPAPKPRVRRPRKPAAEAPVEG